MIVPSALLLLLFLGLSATATQTPRDSMRVVPRTELPQAAAGGVEETAPAPPPPPPPPTTTTTPPAPPHTPTPMTDATTSYRCDSTRCAHGRWHCFYWAGATGWEWGVGAVPGEQVVTLGPCDVPDVGPTRRGRLGGITAVGVGGG